MTLVATLRLHHARERQVLVKPLRKVREQASEATKEVASTSLTRTESRKRQRVMSTSGYVKSHVALQSLLTSFSPSNGEEDDTSPTATSSSRKKQAKGKKANQGRSFDKFPVLGCINLSLDATPSTPQNQPRRSKKLNKQQLEESKIILINYIVY